MFMDGRLERAPAWELAGFGKARPTWQKMRVATAARSAAMSTVELGLTLTKTLDAPSLCTIRDGVIASLDADSVYAHGGLLVGDRISAIYIGVSKHTFAPSAEAAEVERKLGSAHGTVHLTVARPTTASGEFDVVVHKDHPEDKVGLSVSSVTGDASGLPWVETVTTDSRAAHSGLKLGDKVTKVGGTDVHSHLEVTKLIKQSTGDLHLTLQRDPPPERPRKKSVLGRMASGLGVRRGDSAKDPTRSGASTPKSDDGFTFTGRHVPSPPPDADPTANGQLHDPTLEQIHLRNTTTHLAVRPPAGMPPAAPPKPAAVAPAPAAAPILNEAPPPVMTSTAVRYVNINFDAARGEAKLEVNESAFEGAKPGILGKMGKSVLSIFKSSDEVKVAAPAAAPAAAAPAAAEAMPEAEQAAAAVKMQSAQRGMAARRMSKELAASAVVKEAAIDLVVEKAEGVPLGLTLRNSPAQPGQPGPQEEGLVYVKEVTPYSPAADAGLAAGDIIVSVKGEAVVAHDRARDLACARRARRCGCRCESTPSTSTRSAARSRRASRGRSSTSRLARCGRRSGGTPSRGRGGRRRRRRTSSGSSSATARAAAEGLGYSEETWNDMKKWSFAFKAEAEEAKKRKEIAPRAPTAGPVKEGSFLDVIFGGGVACCAARSPNKRPAMGVTPLPVAVN